MPPYLQEHDDATSTATASDHHRGGGGATAPQPPPPKQNQNLLSLLLKPLIMAIITTLFFLFLGFAALILLHLCLAGGLLHRRRATHHQLPLPAAPNPAISPRDLRNLPRFKHPRNDTPSWGDQNPICAVCLEDFRRGQWCRELAACGHVFHRSCVDAWLVKVAACPVCRTRVHAKPDCSRSCTDNRGSKLQL
ncbi:RING-H2 finger protein ATL56-like [Punica granatum]|uniref:RING-type E3 ubiquitin transferase n=2 Tax=Punica granatum TaxID=22663 RepID=A0A2I0LFR4_PUNGR|nr:RING-H2 finger protein ATL56-like [Punica granatum]PKI79528.1 hypothetical protein CRG98_000003 [Punica granatum]